MKREILCEGCNKDTLSGLKLVDVEDSPQIVDPYPGEHRKQVKGLANQNYCCDHCGARILAGNTCYAVSIWADYCGGPYFPWENDFIETEDSP